MLFRERQTELHSQGPSGPSGSAGNLERIRQAGENLYQAADDSIDRALSGNSQAFLEATEQEGGQ